MCFFLLKKKKRKYIWLASFPNIYLISRWIYSAATILYWHSLYRILFFDSHRRLMLKKWQACDDKDIFHMVTWRVPGRQGGGGVINLRVILVYLKFPWHCRVRGMYEYLLVTHVIKILLKQQKGTCLVYFARAAELRSMRTARVNGKWSDRQVRIATIDRFPSRRWESLWTRQRMRAHSIRWDSYSHQNKTKNKSHTGIMLSDKAWGVFFKRQESRTGTNILKGNGWCRR